MRKFFVGCILLLSLFGCIIFQQTEQKPAVTVEKAEAHEHGDISKFDVQMQFSPEVPRLGKEAALNIHLKEAAGKPANLQITHERLFHIMFIDEHLEDFAHIHVEDFWPISDSMKKAGVYTLKHTFANGGKHRGYVEFSVGDVEYMKEFEIDVEGAPSQKTALDFATEQTIDGYKVTLNFQEAPKAGQTSEFSFHLEKDGIPVKDLELLLGADMHLAVWSEDIHIFEHSHPYMPGMENVPMSKMSPHQMYRGPDVPFKFVFEEPHTYKIFAQFKYKGKVRTVPFFVKVS